MNDIEQIKVPMSRLAYLTYDDMLQKIQDKEIDEYDIVYSKDKLTTYIISEKLEPVEMHSRVYVFNSVENAIEQLNHNTDTYIGQVVAILYNGTYRGYIVNEKDETFIVTPLWEHPEPIDYNTLGNRPILNLVGTLETPIVISELNNGIYSIKGQYKIDDGEETIFLAASSILFVIERDSENILVKKITSSEIIDYSIKDSIVSSSSIVTSTFLKEQGFITSEYVDNKIASLDFIRKIEVNDYVNNLVMSILDQELDTVVEKKIDEKIQQTSSEQIDELFID